MAALGHAKKNMNRTFSKKSHSWWWDSHISPKNSKWLAENLEEMDQSVKKMLKLIEEDGDSFAKKAEMYYEKRPKLISQVEEFYRVYRSLAERYDHVTGELRKNVASDLQSQGSGISEAGSELGSVPPSPDERPIRRKSSGHRAAGFDVFLGSGGNHSDLNNKDGDELSSSLDSESESDDSSSVNNYSSLRVNVGDPELRKRIIELEMELSDTKEKLRMQEVEKADGSSKGAKNGNPEELLARIAGFKEELSRSNEEISSLRMKLQKNETLEFTNGSHVEIESVEKDVITQEVNEKVIALVDELQSTKERLEESEKELNSLREEFESKQSNSIRQLQEQLELAEKDSALYKVNLNAEKREASKLQERIARYKTNLSEREQEIRQLRVAVLDAEHIFSSENVQLKANISQLTVEKTHLEEKLQKWEQKGTSLEEEIGKVEAGKAELECLQEANEKRLNSEIEQLKLDITEKRECVDGLNTKLEALNLKHVALISERDELNAKLGTLLTDINSKDEKICEMEKHWHQLHMEQSELIVGTEKAHKLIETLRSSIKELEKDVERQKVLIIEGAEEKREAIRQLCFSLEHYRNGYQRLRQAFVGHKRPAILAT